jgi:3-dehydroquinate synthase
VQRYSSNDSMTDSITIAGAGFAYQVDIGPGLLSEQQRWSSLSAADGVLIVSNDVVAGLYLQSLQQTLQQAGITAHSCILPDGEQHKTIASWQLILDQLLAMQANRNSIVLALGGGVIGDMAGFAAATYMRGIRVIQLPTTLLAQVDAAVGGKTGVNVPSGKNLIGAFHQPAMVVMDTATLRSLPAREFRAGLAEVVKYAVIMDAEFFVWLEQHADALLQRQTDLVTQMICTCVRHKAQVVAADTLERGRRALLNYGHTFAHALESGTGYSHWLHGEAVAIGMHMAASFAQQSGLIERNCVLRQQRLLQRLGFDFTLPSSLSAEQLAAAMLLDKKADQGGITLVLPRAIGEAVIAPGYDTTSLQAHFQQHLDTQ